MNYAPFVHLRVHSAYSLSEGAIQPKFLAKLCAVENMPAVAVTDNGNLFGAMEFADAAKSAGVQPIIGCQILVAADQENLTQRKILPDTLILLAQNEQGYRNLMHLVSILYTEQNNDQAIHWDQLKDHADGLIALSGGPKGAIGRLLLSNQDVAPTVERLSTIFPGRFYIEIMRHGLPEESQIEAGLLALAYQHDLPLVATNDVYFAQRNMHEAHDALLCIADGTYVGEADRRRVTVEHYFKSAEDMRQLFADIPEACDNTLVIAQRCAFMPPSRKPILPAFGGGEEKSEAEILRHQAEEGLKLRFLQVQIPPAQQDAYRERLRFELGVIEQMGFPGYFLIVADFIQWAKKRGISVGPGRGSGVGSVVAWALTITELDPLRWGLLFERFLNPERISMPDFDVDFCQERRDEVIRYVQERYGRDRVAQIITFGKLQARAALRDVGRVLQLPYGQVDKLAKMVPQNPANPVSLAKAIETEPMLNQAAEEDPTVKKLLETALQLEGLYRNASTHAAGIVIGDRPLKELVPLYRDPRSSMIATQFNMKDVEKAGLVKFDFLGLKTLTVIRRAVALLKMRGIDLDIDHLPLDDKKTYEMLSGGEATGVFQMEGAGIRDVLKKLKPDRFEDLIAVVALYRPGPMDNIPRFINCKHGKEEIDYLHPALEGVLQETYGIMVYQEQVMQIAQILAGYSLGAADLLRRAMGKKIKEEMEAQRKIFVDGAVARNVSSEKAGQIFDQVNKFAGYGFNKSHAAAYALIAYQTAYLKAHYPVEFFAATMTYDMANTDKLNIFRQELNKISIKMLPPDVNKSEAAFSVEKWQDGSLAVRYALAAIKNVGQGPVASLVAEREANGSYKDLSDFCKRIDPAGLNKRQLEHMILAGVFDSLHPNRKQLFESADQILRQANFAKDERTSSQSSLFGGEDQRIKITMPSISDWLPIERLQQEFLAIGFYLSAHPLDAYANGLRRLDVLSSIQIQEFIEKNGNTRIKLAGILVGKQERISAKGNRFAFIQLTDAGGSFEVMVFSDRLVQFRELFEPGKALLLHVDARLENEDLRLILDRAENLNNAIEQTGAGLAIQLAKQQSLSQIKKAIDQAGKGKGKIELILDLDNQHQEVRVLLPGKWAVTPVLRGTLQAIEGVEKIVDI